MDQLVGQAFKVSDSIFLVLLLGLAGGTWWIIRYVFKKNDEREKRYIEVIEKQAEALQTLDGMQRDIVDIRQAVMRRGRTQS